MIPHTLSAQIALAIYLAVCLIILRIGGLGERIAGGAMLVQVLLDNLTHDHQGGGPQYWTAGLDMALLIVLGTVAFMSRRVWPLWATAFQLVSTIVHGVKAVDPSVHGWAYLSATILFGWFALAAVLVGSVFALRERRRGRAPAPSS